MVKFNEDIRETIYDLVSKGYTYMDICDVCDISTQTFYNWMNRGKKAKSGKYKEFYSTVEKCKVERKNNLKEELLYLGRAKEDWRSIAWMLERGYDDEFARPEVKIKQTVDAKAEVEVNPWAEVQKIIIESGKKSDDEKKKNMDG